MNRPGPILPPENDPDQTDRLPALEEAAVAGHADVLDSTGTWGSSTAELADRVAELEQALEERDAAVADLTSLLRQKTFAITRVEKELERARSELMRARGAAGRSAELEQRLNEVERERLALAAQHDEQRAVIARLEDQLSESREAEQGFERELAALREESDARERARETASGLLAASEARIVELEARLEGATRETLGAIQLQEQAQLKDQLAGMTEALAGSHEELRAVKASRDALQSRVERLSGELGELRDELREREARAAGLLEQLRNAEAQRRLRDDMREAALPPPAGDPRVGLLARQLEDERSARSRAEQEFAASLETERAARMRAEQALADRDQEVAALREKLARAQASVPTRRCLTRLDPGQEAVFELAGPRITIGRTPENDLLVRESYISRHHAVIRLGPDSAVVEDLGSRNGVFVNDRRVSRELLRDGDVVTLGKARFRFEAARR